MSRQGKQEENLKDRLKSLFRIKDKSAPVAFQRPTVREFIFTPDVLKDIGPESPANNRLRTIRELCNTVQTKKLEENAIEALWNSIKDLVQPGTPSESRQIALHFLHSLIEGQLQYLGILRAHFFSVIEDLSNHEDLSQRLELFKALSENGRNLGEFEELAGPLLLRMMPDVLASGNMSTFLQLLVQTVKYNAAYLDEDVICGLVKQTCMIPNRSRSEENIKMCLDILDAVVCYSYLPCECLQHVIAALCRMINMPKYCLNSWELMKKLLGTHLGHSSIYTMCCMLQDRRQPTDHNLLRGSVFFVGMALWGSKKVPTLKHTFSSVLPSFLQVLSTNSHIVAYEVVLSIHRLVNKYGKDLQHVTWNIIMDILEGLLRLMEVTVPNQPPLDPRMPVDFHDILSIIEDLHMHGQFAGCVSRFFKIIELCASKRPESSVSMLITHHAQMILPVKENWIENLYSLLDKYFRQESRTMIRTKALAVLSFVLSVNKHMHEDELITNIVLPHLGQIDQDSDPEVRKVAAEMLLCLAQSCSHQCFLHIIVLLEKLIDKPLVAMVTTRYPSTEGAEAIQHHDESHLVDIKTGAMGLVDLLRIKLYMYPSSECQEIYQLTLGHLRTQYSSSQDYSSQTAAVIRKSIMTALLQMRSDSLSRLGFINLDQDTQPKFSPYIVCEVKCDEDAVTVPSSPNPVPKESSKFLWTSATLLNYTEAFSLFITCLQHDLDWQVIECVLVNLPLLLQNKTLILSTQGDLIDTLCHVLCAMVNDRQLGFPEKLTNVPFGKFTRSDFHAFIFPVLASMVSYHKHLDRNRQKELIKCLEFGLVSKCAKLCTNALRLCTLEMQEVMMRQLPSVLLQLSKISATISMAIPVLAFLSSIVRLPKMYANFVEDEYMSVFAIALPYTNPFKFSHYTVSLAHHVIAIWFIRCRVPFRKGFVKFIQKGLRANVLQLFEENSMLQLQNEDSTDRNRAATCNEAALSSRRRMLSGSSISRQRYHPPVDDKMSQFHKELTETCTDFMARYTFANYNAVPHRSQEAEFLLKGGQTKTWMLGNKVVTITTSGGGNNKFGNTWLCDQCMAQIQGGEPQEKKLPQPDTPGRRRHKSAVLSRSTSTVQESSKSSSDDIGIQAHTSYDDTSLIGEEQQNVAVQTGRSLTEHSPSKPGFDTEAIESLLWGVKNQTSDGRVLNSLMCNCWCTGWAEIMIRAPSGNLSWMMRIENETSLTSLQESPMTDITMLFAAMRNKPPDMDSLRSSSRIDSGSIGEEEYESLYDLHFPSDSSSDHRSCDIQVKADKEINLSQSESISKEDGGPALATENSPNDPASHTHLLKRSNSSPSLLSGSADNVDMKESISDMALVDVNRAEREVGPSINAHSQSAHSNSANLSLSLSDNHERRRPPPPLTNLSQPTSPVKGSHHLLDLSQSPDSSETSSLQDEVTDLPAFRKLRGHTISIVTTDSKGEEKYVQGRSKVITPKESGRGGVNPSFVFLQLYHGGMLHQGNDMPILLPDNQAITRGLKMLDHIHPYETHKVGIIYVGSGQTKDEKAILRNPYGSEKYAQFLQGLGHLIRLSDCDPNRVYIGGLDVHGSDGQFAYSWQDETMHVIYHVATLMPNKDSDPNCNAKKLHIGNDYVTIVYNDSGEDYKIGAIKGQFNYVNIVIKPLDHESNAVTLQAKEVPFQDRITTEILGHKDTKIISDANLPDLVRQIAVNCDLASLVLQRQQSQPQDPFASNWLERLRQIKRIKMKTLTENVKQVEQPAKHQELGDFTEFV
ncbi:tuberin-like isoform X4 [Mizuhopecten yessoensis]|uniref:tuberin-like isoform X4 n=1 Tax=Mizuhopecten yessoensis TaxID=6573 RepID=UPI000B45A6AF|nr:tuberin-like isoform X4 [Mizuhopecten yessoensis]